MKILKRLTHSLVLALTLQAGLTSITYGELKEFPLGTRDATGITPHAAIAIVEEEQAYLATVGRCLRTLADDPHPATKVPQCESAVQRDSKRVLLIALACVAAHQQSRADWSIAESRNRLLWQESPALRRCDAIRTHSAKLLQAAQRKSTGPLSEPSLDTTWIPVVLIPDMAILSYFANLQVYISTPSLLNTLLFSLVSTADLGTLDSLLLGALRNDVDLYGALGAEADFARETGTERGGTRASTHFDGGIGEPSYVGASASTWLARPLHATIEGEEGVPFGRKADRIADYHLFDRGVWAELHYEDLDPQDVGAKRSAAHVTWDIGVGRQWSLLADRTGDFFGTDGFSIAGSPAFDGLSQLVNDAVKLGVGLQFDDGLKDSDDTYLRVSLQHGFPSGRDPSTSQINEAAVDYLAGPGMSIGATYRVVSRNELLPYVTQGRQATLGVRLPLSAQPSLNTSTPDTCLRRIGPQDGFAVAAHGQCTAARIAVAYSAPAPSVGVAPQRFIALDVGVDYLHSGALDGQFAPNVFALSLDYSVINGQNVSDNARLLRLRAQQTLSHCHCGYLEIHGDLVRLSAQPGSVFGFVDYIDPGRSQTIVSIGARWVFDARRVIGN